MMESQPELLTQIGVVGDVHAESTALSTALAYLQDLGLQQILCVGDIVDGAENIDNCCRLLQQHKVIAVRGNRDRWFLANEARHLPEATPLSHVDHNSAGFIARLPVTRDFKTLSGEVLLCHGLGHDDLGRVTPDDLGYAIEANVALQELIYSRWYRFIVNGHTHRRMVRSFSGLTMINAGTLKREHDPCFLVVDFDAKTAQFYDIDDGRIIRSSGKHAL